MGAPKPTRRRATTLSPSSRRYITEQAPWVWLYVGYNYTAQQPYVTGFVPSPTSSILGLAQAELNR